MLSADGAFNQKSSWPAEHGFPTDINFKCMTSMNDSQILTNERIYIDRPDFYGHDMIERHLNRYRWASTGIVQGGKVLDAACGTGYGAAILLNSAKKYIGVDIDEKAIDYAINRAAKMDIWDKAQYIIMDISKLEFQNDSFDSIVCIETIEHLDADDQELFMRNAVRCLKSSGDLMITTPHKDKEPMTEFHKHEFSLETFSIFLKQFFEKIDFYDPIEFKIPETFILAKCSHGWLLETPMVHETHG